MQTSVGVYPPTPSVVFLDAPSQPAAGPAVLWTERVLSSVFSLGGICGLLSGTTLGAPGQDKWLRLSGRLVLKHVEIFWHNEGLVHVAVIDSHYLKQAAPW